MKLMFASGIYGPLPVTECVLELFAQSGVQWLVISGDVSNHDPCNILPEGYTPAKVAERFNGAVHKVIAVCGNCNSEAGQILLHFPITAPQQQALLGKQRLSLTYGYPFGPENLPVLSQNDVLVYGHTRLPVAEQRGETSYFNLDSISIPKGGNPASYGMLDNDVPSVTAPNDQSIVAQITINP